MGAEELLGPGSCRLKLGDISGRGVRVPPMRKPSVTFSVGIGRNCNPAGALLEPTLLGVSAKPLPDPAPRLPAMPLPGSSGPASDCGCDSASGVSCFTRQLHQCNSPSTLLYRAKVGPYRLLFAM